MDTITQGLNGLSPKINKKGLNFLNTKTNYLGIIMFNYSEEFDNQIKTLILKGYPKLLQQTEEQFTDSIVPLKAKLKNLYFNDIDYEKGYLPFVIVVQVKNIDQNLLVSLTEKNGKKGISKLFPLNEKDFQVTDDIKIPTSNAYLLIDIDRGKETLNVPPNVAKQIITNSKRSPLTIEEGIAILTQYPDYLIKNNCFSLLASRHIGDKRVPAIWINSQKQINLGWCWDGNPHTWLGSASCKERI